MTKRSEFRKLEGLIAAPYTPFAENDDIHLKEIGKQAALLIRDGVRGAYVSGTTDEGVSCSVEERKAVMEE